jgi:hypothetical protein
MCEPIYIGLENNERNLIKWNIERGSEVMKPAYHI